MFKSQATRELRDGELHLYWATLDNQRWGKLFPDLYASLAIDELRRSREFKFPEASRRYILCRGLLRRLIGEYKGWPSSEVSFSYTTHGKPYLASTECDLHFNLSHAGDFAAFVFAREEVGVDIENIRSSGNATEAASVFLSDSEMRQAQGLPAEKRDEFCLRMWTRKEALLKAIGVGLIDDMPRIFVGESVTPGYITTALPSSHNTDMWAIQDTGYSHDIIGAVAFPRCKTGNWSLRQFDLDPWNAVTT